MNNESSVSPGMKGGKKKPRSERSEKPDAAPQSESRAEEKAGLDGDSSSDDFMTVDCEQAGKCLFNSHWMKLVRKRFDLIAGFGNDPVLISGPPGSGKKIAARAFHALSPGRKLPLIVINAFALPDRAPDGGLNKLIVSAGLRLNMPDLAGGANLLSDPTLLIAGLEEAPEWAMIELYEAFDQGEFSSIKQLFHMQRKTRAIATMGTGKPRGESERRLLERLLDFFVWTLRLPSPDERREDVLPVAEEILRRLDWTLRLDAEARSAILNKKFENGFRTLERRLRRAAAAARATGSRIITASMISEKLDAERSCEEAPRGCGRRVWNFKQAVDDYKRGLIADALAEHEGNKDRARAALGMSESGFYRALKRYKLG